MSDAGWRRGAVTREAWIAATALAGIALSLALAWGGASAMVARAPLVVVLIAGGLPLVVDLARSALRGQFGSDLLAGISIVTAALLGEYLAGALVVLMLSGGEALEAYAVGRASSVLHALARRMPSVAHRRVDGHVDDVALDVSASAIDVVVFPHEICPVDGAVDRGPRGRWTSRISRASRS